jgi:ABC-type phosphate/phosphonate transport system substrate-binding protein
VFDLIRAGDPAFASQVRVIAVTDPTPMPPLVATASLTTEEVTKLRHAFRRANEEPSLTTSLKAILVERFVVPDLSVYDETRRRAERVEQAEEWP